MDREDIKSIGRAAAESVSPTESFFLADHGTN
jgi:hypothetical protein